MDNFEFNEAELLKELLDNPWPGFPCFSAVYVDNDLKFIKTNRKAKKGQFISEGHKSERHKSERHKNHAEFILCKEFDFKSFEDQSIVILQTQPPCSCCLEELNNLGIKVHIIWLFDPYKKIDRKLWKGEMKNISFERISRDYKILIDLNFEKYKKRMDTYLHRGARKRLMEKHNGNFYNIKYN